MTKRQERSEQETVTRKRQDKVMEKKGNRGSGYNYADEGRDHITKKFKNEER